MAHTTVSSFTWRARLVAVGMTLALVMVSCSKDEPSGQGSTAAPDVPSAGAQNPEAPFAAMDPVNASMTFASTGDQRDGSWWVRRGQRSRWTYRDFPAELPDLQLDLSVLVEAAAADPTTGAVVDLSYGQGDVTSGTQSVTLPLAASPNDPKVLVASGNVTLPRTTLPDEVSSLWLEATTSASSSLGTRGDSARFTPLALHRLPAQTAATPPAAPRPKDSGVVVGEFSSDGDPISGWYWLRDSAHTASGTWTFAGVPSGKADLRLELDVLATDRASGGPGVDARFYVDYAPVAGPGGGPKTETPVPPKTRPSSSTTSPPTSGGTTGANSQLVTLTNTSPPGDPVGYTNTGVMTIPRSKIPSGTEKLAVKITRVDATGDNPVSEHIAVRQESVKLAWGATTGGSTTTTSMASTTTTTTGEDGPSGETETTGPGSDTDLTNDANTMDDALARGDLANGEYQGTLEGEDDDDYFAFMMQPTQIVDIAVTSESGASIETELWNPSRVKREPVDGGQNRMAFSHAASRSAGGRWFLHLRRMNHVSTAYTFTINVRDANDAALGVDAGDDAAGSTTVTFQSFTAELYRDDPADDYTVRVAAGGQLSATITSLSGNSLEVQLLPPTGNAYAQGTTANEPRTLVADVGSSPTNVRIVVRGNGDDGGRYRLSLTTSTSSDCSAAPVPATSFSTSGASSSRVVHRDGAGNPIDLLVAGQQPVTDPANWRWLQANADQPENQTAQWIFDQRPNGDDDYRFVIGVPTAATDDVDAPMGAVYVSYGSIPGSGVDAVQGGELVGLAGADDQPVTGFSGHAEIVVPHAALAAATQGIWIRIGLADPTGQRPPATDAGIGVAPASVQLCIGVRGTTTLSGASDTTPPPSLTVAYQGGPKRIVASSSVFLDVATDIDHDGINQNFENAAGDLVNPIIVVDEEEMWLHNRGSERTTNFTTVAPYPSPLHPRYIIFSYLTTWSYDPGGGIQQTGIPGSYVRENHRGDSERIYSAWKVVDDRTLALEWVSTSAHKSFTDHSAVWHVTDRVCNTANYAHVTIDSGLPEFGVGGNEPMCSNLTFDDQGRLVMFAAENKHAVYPTEGVCEAITLGELAGHRVFGEDCGWQPEDADWSWHESDFNNDRRYLGNGRWRFAVYNVGAPGYPLIDDLERPESWKGLTTDQRTQLTGSYNAEAVWSGSVEDPTQFCGGKANGGSRQYPPGSDYPAPCSTRLGSKFEAVPAQLKAALDARYRLQIKTGNVDGAGTDEYIWFQVFDDAGTVLAGRGNYLGDFERGSTDIVWLPPQHAGGAFSTVTVGRSSSLGNRPDWYLESITVEDKVAGTTHTYPANRWIEQSQTYTLTMGG